MRAALYVRVSTADRQHPDMQMRELRDYCHQRGWAIASEYVDMVSGSEEKRLQLDQMLSKCRARKVDAVVVWRYDRFARSLKQLVNALDEFRSLGIEFVSLHDGCDTTTAQGRLLFGIMASLAEFERELIRERVRAGLDAARARGRHLGRPRQTVDVDKVAKFRAQGLSWRTIAAQTGLGLGTVYRLSQQCSKNPSILTPATD